jgi:NTE family protein
MHQPSPQQHQDQLLEQHVRALLGDLEPAAMALLREHLQWVELAAGETLMSQGENGDSMYLSISGRLRAYVRDDDGSEHMVREMARGQVVGEMSLYTDEPRSATVVAIRDSVLVRLSKPAFNELLAKSPQMSVAITRQMIKRLQALQTRSELARPVTLGVLPISPGADALAFARELGRHLEPMGRVCVIQGSDIQTGTGSGEAAPLGPHGEASPRGADSRAIALRLDQIEARHDYVLLVADDGPTDWTQRCSRRCDEMLLVAGADAAPVLHPTEAQYLMRRQLAGGRAEAAEILVLLHPADRRCPSGTRAWLDRRPLADHFHVRRSAESGVAGADARASDPAGDFARLARTLSRNAVGLVLAGGGARGLAHIGLVQALHERAIEIDYVGGTSIGAVMAALVASDRPLPEQRRVARRAFSGNPTGDFNLVPLLSLITGRRLKRIIRAAIEELFGKEPDVEDLWKPFFCVASNYSQASEYIFNRGPLLKAVLASISIPGALPPVLHEGDLLCDGGTFNNFPFDAMRLQRGVGRVIGVDLGWRKPRRIEHEEVPGSLAMLRDRLRPRARRRYRFPSLVAYLMNVTVLYSTSRQRSSRKLTDLYFNPPLERVGMLQWRSFDSIVAQGHSHGVQLLDALPADALAPYRSATTPHPSWMLEPS